MSLERYIRRIRVDGLSKSDVEIDAIALKKKKDYRTKNPDDN